MGNYLSTNGILPEETLATYVELTYLKKNEIQYIVKILDNANPGKLCENIQHRFTVDEVETILPQIRCSPFRDSIYRVFSSEKDNRLSLEDVLDLCSAFSKHCPSEIRAAWAFYIFDTSTTILNKKILRLFNYENHAVIEMETFANILETKVTYFKLIEIGETSAS